MTPLVKKEIRLLLPGFLAVLALEILAPWFLNNLDEAFNYLYFVFFFGMVILAVDSFGREFSPGTFTLLMSQPVERRQIWRTKIAMLLLASALIFIAYFLSCRLRLHLAITDMNSIWPVNPKLIRADFWDSMIASVVVMLVALTGGLWTTLLLRQSAAAFWITLLAPVGYFMLITLVWVGLGINKFFHPAGQGLLCGMAGIYSIFGFWLAHRLFYQAQDTAWTGGVINFSRWRYYESARQTGISERRRRPVAALLKKEFQLHSVSLICAGALLVVHLAVILLRATHGKFAANSLEGTVSEFYWALWLVMPLVIGGTAVAEERRLGVMEEQFCLPASRRLQFILKFFPAILSGLFFGAIMPLLVERIAAALGAPNPDFQLNANGEAPVSNMIIAGWALGLSLAGVFGSTLMKNFLQAFGAAIATIVGCWLFTYCVWNFHPLIGPPRYPPLLATYIAILTALAVFPWLAYRNFKHFLESRRMLQRNVFGLAGAVLCILASSAVIYNRAWEVFEPAEPAHGPAKYSLAKPPALQSGELRGDLLLHTPDDRVWFDLIGSYGSRHYFVRVIYAAFNPFPTSIGPQKFLNGSNWISYVVRRLDFRPAKDALISPCYLETVGIKADGTLWVSAKSDSPILPDDRLSQFGDDTNWQAVSWSAPERSVLLLKKDGTLWRWDTDTNKWDWNELPSHWPALQNFNPHQIGTNSDWTGLAYNSAYVQKADGSVWSVWPDSKTSKDRILRETNFDQVDLHKLSLRRVDDREGFIRKDGTLWVCGNLRWANFGSVGFETFQVGKETNWVSVAVSWYGLVALKSDGTLWQKYWNFWSREASIFTDPPMRLSIHNDWVAIAEVRSGGVAALAADGSLWLWPNRADYQYDQLLLKPPKQPQYLGNVFGKGK